MEKHYLYIVLTRTNTVISKIIQLVKNDEYTHAAISLDKELNYMYSFSRKYTYNPFYGSFNQEKINKGVYKCHKILPGIIIEIKVSKEQYENAKKLLDNFLYNSKDYKYNYKGLINSLFNKAACCDNRFLCSEFVYYILKENGIVDFQIPRNLVRPQNLLRLKGKIIYKGDLKQTGFQNSNYTIEEIEISKLEVACKWIN